MKKLSRLLIDREKVINNEELVNLKGGYGDGSPCTCTCYHIALGQCSSYLYSATGNCAAECAAWLGTSYSGNCGNCTF